MVKLKLIRPEDHERTKFEKVVAVGGLMDFVVSAGLIYATVEVGSQLYRRVRQATGYPNELRLHNGHLVIDTKDATRKISVVDILQAEVRYYDGESQGFERKYDFSTLIFRTAGEEFLVQTIASKARCRTLLGELYAMNCTVRDYNNDLRTYLLQKPLYKEIQQLKAQYGPDFW